MEAKYLEALVRQVVEELLQGGGVKKVPISTLTVSEAHRLDTGKCGDRVYTRDVVSVEESPRLGAGIMELTDSRFPWTLNYDEVDYILQGQLDIIWEGKTTSAGPGDLLYLPKGSEIQFSARGHCRLLYVVTPANWQSVTD